MTTSPSRKKLKKNCQKIEKFNGGGGGYSAGQKYDDITIQEKIHEKCPKNIKYLVRGCHS